MEPEASQAKEKRNVHRSPSYPVFDLAEAIEKSKLVYTNDKRVATSADVIASHLGYSAAKGPGGRAVSALKQYGLIEEAAGKYRISDLAFTLIHFDRDSDEWRTAVAKAARNPLLFRELLDENPDGLPSDAALRSDLLKRGFNPTAIADVVSIIRNTVSLAGEGHPVYNETGETSMSEQPNEPKAAPPPTKTIMQGAMKLVVPVPVRAYAFDISIPREVKGELKITGEFGKDDVERLRKALTAQIAMIEAALED